MNPFQMIKAYGLVNKIQSVLETGTMTPSKVTQVATLLVTLLGTVGIGAFGQNWLQGHAMTFAILAAAAQLLHALFPSLFAAVPASAVPNSTAKLGCLALIGLMLMVPMETGCNGNQVAQDIVNWTPALTSAVNVVGSAASVLDPAAAPIFVAATVMFDASSNVVVAEAKAYLANPSNTLLQALQQGVLTFQQQVNNALLQAAKITNPASQQHATGVVNAVATIINTILALVQSISSKTAVALMASHATIKLAIVEPYMRPEESARILADHYGDSGLDRLSVGMVQLEQAGF